MKKLIVCIIACAALAVFSENVTYDMANYGTTASITNNVSVGTVTYTAAFITYDAATTNTITFYATVDGVDYLLGTDSVTNAQYSYIDLRDIALETGNVFKITTADTNVTVFLPRQ